MADGYAARLLAQAARTRSTWLVEAGLVAALSGAAALAWHALAAHPMLRLAGAVCLAAEGLFYLVSRLRWVAMSMPACCAEHVRPVGAGIQSGCWQHDAGAQRYTFVGAATSAWRMLLTNLHCPPRTGIAS